VVGCAALAEPSHGNFSINCFSFIEYELYLHYQTAILFIDFWQRIVMLEVRFLGKFEVKHNKKQLNISSRPAQSLFAYLILSAGTSHRREKLAGLLWPDSLEETARDNLRHALWRMRKALVSASPTKLLHADDVTVGFKESSEYWLDAAELEKLSENASAEELIAVLSNYQGELLPGFYDEWVVLEREHLSSVFEHHMARLMSLLQDEKRWLDILDWAERWIKLGQKPEPAYRALMSAHGAKGDMSKVAATYERCVKSLKEYGVQPSEQTRALYERLKAGKENLETGPTVPVKERSREAPKTNLPVPLTSFIGREREIEEVKHLLSSTRLLTLTGSGGIGKTRLAIRAASDLIKSYKDGVWWVELAPLIDEALVPQAVAQVLGVRQSSGQPLTESVNSFLREKQLLLVLDNCEHLIAACAQLADDLLTHCADLRILTTSRERLGTMGETTLRVPVLSVPALAHSSQIQNLKEFESIQLFFERAAASRPGLVLTQQNSFTVTQICRRLDGIPLALELAARVTSLSLEEIAARLDDRFTLLTHGNRTALPRHQTLYALIDWSYDLLSEPERVLWRRLSVFIGGWTLIAAGSVCGGDGMNPGYVLELLSRLVDKSLVIGEDRDGTTRYRMLETIRQYGQEKLQGAGEAREIRARHLAFCLELAEEAQPKLLTEEQKRALAELDADYGNLRSALDWATETEAAEALRLAVALGQFWEVRGYIGEGRIAIEQALGQAPDAPKEIRAKGLRWQAQLAGRQGDYAGVKEPIEESLNLWRELGDKPGLANALGILGDTCLLQANYAEAQTAYEESLALFQEIGEKRGIAAMTTNLGNVANSIGDYATARQHQEASIAIFRELGDKLGLVIALNNLGVVAEQQGDISAAKRFYEESIATAHELGEKNMVAYALNSLAHVVYLQGDPIDAQRYYRESLAVCQEIGEKRVIAYCLEGFAKVAARYGDAAQAARLLGAAEALRQAIGAPLSRAERNELDQDVIVTRERLGQGIFDAAWTKGRAMTMEQAVEYALKETQA
jgi:predicted ATPase/DNA-binding SARP family transcriptional activator